LLKSGYALVVALLFALLCICQKSVQAQGKPVEQILYSSIPKTYSYKNPAFPGIEYERIVRPTIGLALSGGGFKGIAHAGVLEALTDSNIPIDYITGTSAGSIIGGLYALGYSIQEIDSIARHIDYNKLFLDQTQRKNLFVSQKEQSGKYMLDVRFKDLKPHIPLAISSGQNINRQLMELYMESPLNTIRDFNKFKVPFRSVATELGTGKRVVLDHGNWVEAIRSSMSVPLVLSPVHRNNELLIDGGVADNIPIHLAREIGADMVIAVDVRAKLYSQSELKSMLTVADQIINILMNSSRDQVLNDADVVITPDLTDSTDDTIEQPAQLIKSGYNATMAKIEEIRTRYEQLATQDRRKFSVNSLKIHGNKILTKNQILNIIETTGLIKSDTISGAQIDSISEQLMESGYFKDVAAVLKDSADTNTLNILLTEHKQVHSVRLIGVTQIPDSAFVKHLQVMEGMPYNAQMLEILSLRMLDEYRDRGYPLAKIDTVLWEPNNGIVTVQFSEGEIGGISVHGNQHTKRYIIMREVKNKPGDILRRRVLDRSITNIYSTELFDIVGAEFTPISETNTWELIINVQEKNYLGVKFGARISNQRGDLGVFGVDNQNFLGNGIRIGAQLKLGTQQGYFYGHLGSYRLLNTYITYDLGIGVNWDWFQIYDNPDLRDRTFRRIRNYFSYSLGHQIARLGLVSFTGQLQKLNFKGPATESNRYNNDYTLTTFSLQSVIDTKDRADFPRTGNYQRIYYQIGVESVGSEIGYTKFSLESDWYFTFWKRNTIHPRIEVGLGDQTIPFSEWFHLGGIDSFFGLNAYEIWGKKLYLGGLEYRYRLPVSSLFDLHFYFRYDIAAMTSETLHHISAEDFFPGYGGGVGVTTPLGPASIALGNSSKNGLITYFYFGWQF